MDYRIILALMTALAVDHVSANYEFFDSDVYKKSVAFNAPVIDPVETRKLLLELNKILPQNEKLTEQQIYMMYNKDSDKYYKIERFNRDLNDLIQLTDIRDKDNCREKHFFLLDSPNFGTNSLSSPAGNKHYGPNIQAYIKHYKLAAIEHCESLLKKGISDASSLDHLTSFIKTLVPNGVNSIEDYSTSSNIKTLTEKMGEFVKSDNKKEFIEKFEAMKNSCKNLSGKAEYRGFVLESLKDQQVAYEVMANKELINLGMINEACTIIQYKIDRSSVKGGFRSKIKNLIH